KFTLELDYLYRSNDFDRVTFADGRTVSDGNYASVTIGANAYYRFRRDSAFQPYLGAGIGWIQEVDVDFEENGVETSFETDELGLQLMAGFRWTSESRWLVDAQLRWLSASGVTMESELGAGTVEADYKPLTLLVGVGWRW
ncbi:MAG: OmpW family outer membrane protein, partial [Acidobacteriota bacterium]